MGPARGHASSRRIGLLQCCEALPLLLGGFALARFFQQAVSKLVVDFRVVGTTHQFSLVFADSFRVSPEAGVSECEVVMTQWHVVVIPQRSPELLDSLDSSVGVLVGPPQKSVSQRMGWLYAESGFQF